MFVSTFWTPSPLPVCSGAPTFEIQKSGFSSLPLVDSPRSVSWGGPGWALASLIPSTPQSALPDPFSLFPVLLYPDVQSTSIFPLLMVPGDRGQRTPVCYYPNAASRGSIGPFPTFFHVNRQPAGSPCSFIPTERILFPAADVILF